MIVIIQENKKGVAHSTCNSQYGVPNKIPIVFDNESSYGYHFIRKVLAKCQLLVNNFEQIKHTSKSEKTTMKKVMKGIFSKLMLLKNYMKFIMISASTRKNED